MLSLVTPRPVERPLTGLTTDTTPNVAGGPFVQGLAALGGAISSLVLPRGLTTNVSGAPLTNLPGVPLNNEQRLAVGVTVAVGVAAWFGRVMTDAAQEAAQRAQIAREQKEKQDAIDKKNLEVADAQRLANQERERRETAVAAAAAYQDRARRAELEIDRFLHVRLAGLIVPPVLRTA